jgi:hypothetical protein
MHSRDPRRGQSRLLLHPSLTLLKQPTPHGSAFTKARKLEQRYSAVGSRNAGHTTACIESTKTATDSRVTWIGFLFETQSLSVSPKMPSSLPQPRPASIIGSCNEHFHHNQVTPPAVESRQNHFLGLVPLFCFSDEQKLGPSTTTPSF